MSVDLSVNAGDPALNAFDDLIAEKLREDSSPEGTAKAIEFGIKYVAEGMSAGGTIKLAQTAVSGRALTIKRRLIKLAGGGKKGDGLLPIKMFAPKDRPAEQERRRKLRQAKKTENAVAELAEANPVDVLAVCETFTEVSKAMIKDHGGCAAADVLDLSAVKGMISKQLEHHKGGTGIFADKLAEAVAKKDGDKGPA